MKIIYDKLWKLLVEKGMTKGDLMEATGLSSRVIAKLAKNQTVTTDTLLHICEALNCGISDIMECVDEDNVSLYQMYRLNGSRTDENKLYTVSSFTKQGRNYSVFVSADRAAKSTHIECREDGTIYWIEFYPFGGIMTPRRTEKVFFKPVLRDDEIQIVVIKGKPGMIKGLDEGIYLSYSRSGSKGKKVYVITEAEFKLFDPK